MSLLVLLSACPRGGGTTPDTERAHREVQLADALYREGNVPGAISRIRAALELDEEFPEAHLLMAIVQFHSRNNVPVAEEHARRGVELLIDHERYGATLAEARNILGTVLIAAEKYDEAIPVLRESAIDDMNTSAHLAWANVGTAYLRSERPAEAIEPLQDAVRIQPRFCVGYSLLGEAYARTGAMEDAEDALVRALEADESCADSPQMQSAWRLRGEVRANLGRPREAVADLERCIALGPDTEDGEACQRILDQPAPETESPRSEPTSDAPSDFENETFADEGASKSGDA